MAAGDLEAARDQIQREIAALERSLGPDVSSIDVIVSGGSSSDDSDDDFSDTLDEDLEADELVLEDGGHRAEMCLQMNLVYQAVLQEKLQEVEHQISQNKAQQEELLWELAGRKTQRVGSTKPYPANLSIGHFYKPYFKDKVSGVGPPANPEMMARSSHIVKTFKELASKKWRTIDQEELRKAVLSDSLQKMLQPKLFKLEYLRQKRDTSTSDSDKKILTKQIQELEQEINGINHLPEETLLGHRTDDHDWEKISNVNLEGIHNADRISKIWKNDLHPHINKEDWGEEEIKSLQEIAQEHNHVNWEVIAEELGTKRTAFQCLQHYQHNNKDFKRKAFIKEEDEVLKHLVQRMRVGMHIPYHKIAYFMEGRNSMQLLHRWSKCLDPSLKKGYWNKEEDKLLLKAVEKYGAKDWYKIREEVPRRSDIQCRERYMKGLHKDVKKGQWSEEEKQKLIELTEKYGVGHWSKVSKELPHRNGSQCLSKWKNLTGYFKRQRLKRQQNGTAPKRRAPRKRPRKRPKYVAPQEQPQSMVQQERPQYTAPEQRPQYTAPEPRPQYTAPEPRPQYTAPEPRPQYTAPEPRPQYTAPKIKEEELSEDDVSDISSDTMSSYISSSTTSSSSFSSSGSCTSSDGSSSSGDSSSSEDGDDMLDIEERLAATRFLESMPDLDLWIPRKENPGLFPKKATCLNSYRIPRSTMRGKRGKFQFSTILKGIAFPPSTDIVTEHPEDVLIQAKESGHHILQICEDDVRRILRWNTIICQGKQARQTKPEDDTSEKLPPKSKVKRKDPPVDRSLLITVTPWVGNVYLPIHVRYKSPWESQIYADVMTKKLSALAITSTPIFTLLIQFFQINTAGCLQMIRLRKSRGSQSVQNRKRDKAVNMSLKRPYAPSSNVCQSQPAGSVVRSKDESGPQAKHQCPPRDPGPPSKPKTVFELLKEKRLKESKARRAAAQKTVVVAPRILISSQLVVSQAPISAGQPENPALPAASTTSQNEFLQTLPFVALPTCQGVPTGSIASDHLSPATGDRQGTDADKSIAPAQDAKASDKCNSSPSGACPEQPAPAMASPQLPIQLLPRALSNSTTWILTPQGLIQIPVQALFPTATQVAINQDPLSIKAVDPSANRASSTVPAAPARTSSTMVYPPVPESNTSSPLENTQRVAAPCVSPAPKGLIQLPVQALFPTAIQAPMNPDPGSIKAVDPSANGASSTVPAAPASTSGTVVHPPESNMSSPLENTQRVAAPCVSLTPQGLIQIPVQALFPTATQAPMNPDPGSIKAVDPSANGASSTVSATPASTSGTVVHPPESNWSSPLGNTEGVTAPCVSLTPQGLIQIPVQALFHTATQAPMNPDPGSIKAVDPAANGASSTVPDAPARTSSNVVHPSESNWSSPLGNTEGKTGPCVSPAPSLHMSTEVTLTPTKKYPVMKIAKIVPPNQPNTGTCNMENIETPAPSQTFNQASTSSAQRNFGDLSLISLEDETSVKDWMQGKSSGESQESSMAYLPPSACTLKTFSRILLQKTNLEKEAFRLVSPDQGSDGDASRKQEILDDLVEQKLKHNPAYHLLKKRFLSAFTFAGLLAVFPVEKSEITKPVVKSEVKDEDEIMDVGMYDKNTEDNRGGESPGATTELHPHEGEMMDPDDLCAPVTIECESEAENFGMRLRSRKVYCRSET